MKKFGVVIIAIVVISLLALTVYSFTNKSTPAAKPTPNTQTSATK